MLECRETKQDYLYMMDDKVKRCLRLVNQAISDNFVKMWQDFVITNLEWNNRERANIKSLVSKEYELFVEKKAKEKTREEKEE